MAQVTIYMNNDLEAQIVPTQTPKTLSHHQQYPE